MLSKNHLREIRALHLKKFRYSRRLFIAEGVKTVTEIISQRPQLVESVYAEAAFLKNHAADLAEKKIGFHEVGSEQLRAISLQSNPNHVLAVCRQLPETAPAPQQLKGFSFYLDDIRDPGNFGTIVRLSDWFGASQLYCSPSSCELYNPKVIQSSMGAFLRVQVHYLPLNELLETHKIERVYGAVLDGADIYREKLAPGLVLIGNEAHGISAANLGLVNLPLTIPAHSGNGSESLNAAMAAGIIASEFFRQLRDS